MRQVPISAGLLIFWQNAVFLEAALLAHPDTKQLAPPVTKVLDEFPTIFGIDLNTRRGVLQGRARGVMADSFIDEALRGVFAATLFLVKQNRSAVEFTTLFASHIGDIIKYALKRQIEVAKVVAEKLGMNIYSPSFRDEQTAALEPHITHGETVVDEQRKAAIARAETRLEIQAWKQNVNSLCTGVEGDLLKIASQTKRGKDWVASFFLRASSASVDEEESADPPEPTPEG